MPTNSTVNLLVLVVVSGRQSEDLMQALSQEHFYFTKIDSSGMVFQEPTVCLLIGLNNKRLSALLGVVTQSCKPHQEYVPVQFNPPAGFPPMAMIEAQVGGALVYALNVERFEQI